VKRNNHVGCAEVLVKAGGEHGSSAVAGFLRRLPDEYQCAVPLFLERRQRAGSANHGGYVHVVPASMHHAYFLAGGVFCLHVARVGDSGLLDNG
jgi:hypothetical protein